MLALLNMYLITNQPKPIRYAFLAVPIMTLMILLIRDIRGLLLFVPVIVTFGKETIDYGPFYTSPATIAVILAFFAFMVHRHLGFREKGRFPPTIKLVAVAYLFQLASVFATLYIHDNLTWNVVREGNKHFLGALILPVVYFWYGRGEWLDRFLKVLVLLLLGMCIYGIHQYTSGTMDTLGELASGFDLAGRVYSTIGGGPNSYSGVLELLVPSVLGLFFYFRNRFWKTLAFMTVILGVMNVLYTFSRGGFLTVTATCLLYLIHRHRKRIWIPVLSLLIFIGFISANAHEFERQLTVFNDPRELMLDTSLLHRYTSYRGFIHEMSRDPLEGVGWGSREYFHGRTSLYGFWEVRHEQSVNKIDRFGGLNSLILEMPLKGGILSSLALLILIIAVIKTILKVVSSGDESVLGFGFACGLIGFGLHQMFDNLIPWPQTGAFFWMVLGLLTAMAYPCCGNEGD